jgi:rhodanese-related sulfurtransferase
MSVKHINPKDAWKILQDDKNSILVDVRTDEEFSSVGLPDLSSIDAKLCTLPWRLSPDMRINQDFTAQLNEFIASLSSKPINLLFLCRGGGRSTEAAIQFSNFGYNCYNIASGFEGDADERGQRGRVNGWKAENLPWRMK